MITPNAFVEVAEKVLVAVDEHGIIYIAMSIHPSSEDYAGVLCGMNVRGLTVLYTAPILRKDWQLDHLCAAGLDYRSKKQEGS